MDLFVTPEKQRDRPSVSLRKTPVRRKLIVDDDDDDNEIASEKKGQSRTTGGGLRQFSVMGLSQSLSLSLKSFLLESIVVWVMIHSFNCLFSQCARSWKPRRSLHTRRYHTLIQSFFFFSSD